MIKLYNEIITKPSCLSSWENKNDIEFTDKQWKLIFSLPGFTTKSTRLCEMQLKIIHRTYASDSHVSLFDPTVNKICQVCGLKNDILHTFFYCSLLTFFLSQLENWIKKHIMHSYQLDCKTFIFGILEDDPFNINYIQLHAKWFIHKVRQRKNKTVNNIHFSFLNFIQHLKQAINTEKQIAINNFCLQTFNESFNTLQTATGRMYWIWCIIWINKNKIWCNKFG